MKETIISRLYKGVVRSRIFAQSEGDAEIAHEWGLQQLVRLQRSWALTWITDLLLVYRDPILETKVFGVRFPNPLGLAAGFDKYCQAYPRAIPACGWGSVEVGGITQWGQEGNPRPRMLRSL